MLTVLTILFTRASLYFATRYAYLLIHCNVATMKCMFGHWLTVCSAFRQATLSTTNSLSYMHGCVIRFVKIKVATEGAYYEN
mgnify:CR=1 FL=1